MASGIKYIAPTFVLSRVKTNPKNCCLIYVQKSLFLEPINTLSLANLRLIIPHVLKTLWINRTVCANIWHQLWPTKSAPFHPSKNDQSGTNSSVMHEGRFQKGKESWGLRGVCFSFLSCIQYIFESEPDVHNIIRGLCDSIIYHTPQLRHQIRKLWCGRLLPHSCCYVIWWAK